MMDDDSIDFQDEDKFHPQSPRQLDEEAAQCLLSFTELLDTIPMDGKIKALWKQIYKNAITDRKNALMVWSDLYMKVHGNAEMHAMHGDRIAKYMDQISKANAQLLKLAELVQKLKEEKEAEDLPRGNALFDKIEKKLKS